MAPSASTAVALGMLVLPLLVAATIIAMIGRYRDRAGASRAAVVLIGWLTLTGVLSAVGVFARFDTRPPAMMPFMGVTLVLTSWLAFSRVGLNIGHSVPMAALVGLQAFRLPLELLMHRAATEAVMPNQMSYSGLNFDIVTGATAIVVALLASRQRAPRWLLIAWNVMGLALVVTIATIGVASSPVFMAFGSDPASVNSWIAWFPFAWLPTFLVPVALAGHVVMLRRLRSPAARA